MTRYATVALMLSACAGNTDALQRENDALRARVGVLEAQNENLRRQVRAAQRPEVEIPERIELPRAEAGEARTFHVAVVANGDTFVDGTAVNDNELAALARAAGDGTRAVIAADRGVPYQRVVQIMDVLRDNGISSLALAVQPTP